jgi:hypothetical protein
MPLALRRASRVDESDHAGSVDFDGADVALDAARCGRRTQVGEVRGDGGRVVGVGHVFGTHP